jgi:hypothetical protein
MTIARRVLKKTEKFRNTKKQAEIMKIILTFADRGELLCLAELQRTVSWRPKSHITLGISVKFLETHGFVDRRFASYGETDVSKMLSEEEVHAKGEDRRGKRLYLLPTAKAYSYYRRRPETI